ncbi:hypothetical protein [Methanocaldococcus jannaschii]|uniref:hypothetical protein n=1 Tax=Methanocaldococcus jannaschii TaxID=2190 RepID=UPI0007DC3A41|nr:hypothetical protein [Methanocaldococcus jannaschii]
MITIITEGINSLSKIPEDFLIILFGVLFVIFLTNKSKIIDSIKETIKEIKNMFLKLIKSVKNILEPLLLFVKFNIKAVGYLFYRTTKTINEIKKLESYRPNNQTFYYLT